MEGKGRKGKERKGKERKGKERRVRSLIIFDLERKGRRVRSLVKSLVISSKEVG